MQFYTSLGLNTENTGTSSAMDYSYLLGRRGQITRHNPHVQQSRDRSADLQKVARLLRAPELEPGKVE